MSQKKQDSKKNTINKDDADNFLESMDLVVNDPLLINKSDEVKKEVSNKAPKQSKQKKQDSTSNTLEAINGLSIEIVMEEIERLKTDTNVFTEKRTSISLPISVNIKALDFLNEIVGSKTYELASALIILFAKQNKKQIAELIAKRKKEEENFLTDF